MPGVKVTWKDDDLKEVQYAGQIIAAVAAETEEAATEAAHRVKVNFKPREHQVRDDDAKFFNAEKDKPGGRAAGPNRPATDRSCPHSGWFLHRIAAVIHKDGPWWCCQATAADPSRGSGCGRRQSA
jgi:hypothetical protein